jgi:phosphomannomutase / phosphoglucomutase
MTSTTKARTTMALDLAAMRHVFRAYDIRGVAGTEISGGFARALGLAFARYLTDTQPSARTVALGMDNRPSSPLLHASVCDGLLAGGLDVRDLGLVSSPMVGYAVCRHHLDGGICVTGSHNSPGSNGFKLEAGDAFPLAEADIERLRELMCAGCGEAVCRGTIEPLEVREGYLKALSSLVQLERPVRVAVDAGSGVMGLFAPDLFRKLGCDVVELLCQPDSTFPRHIPNPEDPANMRDLQTAVVSAGADIGVAFDGDGDRLGVVDETGALYGPGETLIVLARDLLQRRPGSHVLIDVKSSRTVIEDIRAHNGVPLLTRTGHSLIRRRMATEGILLGGEYSGHFFCAEDFHGTSDALLAAAKLIMLLSRHPGPLSQLLGRLPRRYASELVELQLPEDGKHQVVNLLTRALSERYPAITIDGVRVEMADGWALVRASNTGPRIAVRVEADSTERLNQIYTETVGLLTETIANWHSAIEESPAPRQAQ